MGNLPSELHGPDELNQYWLLLASGEKVFLRWEPACLWWFWKRAEPRAVPANPNSQEEGVHVIIEGDEWQAISPGEPWQHAEFALSRALPRIVAETAPPIVAFPDVKELKELCVFRENVFVRPTTYANGMPSITPIWYLYGALGWSWSPYFPPAEWIPCIQTRVTAGS